MDNSLLDNTYDKVRRLRALINAKNAEVMIEIDGGVTSDNAAALVQAGADVLVAGSFVFKSQKPSETISNLHTIANT